MLLVVKGLKTDNNEVESGKYVRRSDGKLCFSEKERGEVWKDIMDIIQNEEMIWIIMWKEMQ